MLDLNKIEHYKFTRYGKVTLENGVHQTASGLLEDTIEVIGLDGSKQNIQGLFLYVKGTLITSDINADGILYVDTDSTAHRFDTNQFPTVDEAYQALTMKVGGYGAEVGMDLDIYLSLEVNKEQFTEDDIIAAVRRIMPESMQNCSYEEMAQYIEKVL